MIPIFETLFILALDDEEGKIPDSILDYLKSALAGAVLAELVLQNRIDLTDQWIIVVDQTPIEHPILNRALFDIIDAARARKINYWINALTYKNLQEEIGHHLVEGGVLIRKKKRLHLDPSLQDEPGGTGSIQHSLINHLREVVLASQELELSERVLIALLNHGEFLKKIFAHGERKTARKRIHKVVEKDKNSSRIGKALDEIIAIACESGH